MSDAAHVLFHGAGPVQTLIDEGLLWPGENVLSVDYKQTTTLATLTPEGRIFCHSAPPSRL